MPDILVRGVRDDVHRTLQRRASEERMSLQAYVTRILEHESARPTINEWLARLDDLAPVATDISGAEAVAAARDELR